MTGIAKQIHLRLTPYDPCLTLDQGNALRFGQWFSLPNVVAIGISKQTV